MNPERLRRALARPNKATHPVELPDPDPDLVAEIQRELDAHPTWRVRRPNPRDPGSPAYERRGTITRDGYRGDRRSR